MDHHRRSIIHAAPTIVSDAPPLGGSGGRAFGSSSAGGGGGGTAGVPLGASASGNTREGHGQGPSFFERERDRLIDEVSSGFEDLMSSTNVLNRKLEEVFGVGKEFETVAGLWGRFNTLIRQQKTDDADTTSQSHPSAAQGVPGTGGANFRASVAVGDRER